MRWKGSLIPIAFMGGGRVTLVAMPLMLKRLTFAGSTLRARSVRRENGHRVWPLLEAGSGRDVLSDCRTGRAGR
ncbi:hypothetical protein CS8_037220 [Cupriavidus sp. 8B]